MYLTRSHFTSRRLGRKMMVTLYVLVVLAASIAAYVLAR